MESAGSLRRGVLSIEASTVATTREAREKGAMHRIRGKNLSHGQTQIKGERDLSLGPVAKDGKVQTGAPERTSGWLRKGERHFFRSCDYTYLAVCSELT